MKRAAWTCRLLVSFECASLSAFLKRTAAITQAGLGSQTIRSETVAFKTLRSVIEVAYIFASLKAIIVNFFVWENIARKEIVSCAVVFTQAILP